MSESSGLKLAAIFAELISYVHEPSALWLMMMHELERAVGFDAGYIAASWGGSSEGRGAVLEHDEPFLKSNLGRFLAEFTEAEIHSYTEQARNYETVWPEARCEELAVFRELLRPTGMRRMLVRVGYRNGNVAGFNLERRGVCAAFTEEDCATIDAVAPFLHVAEQLTLATQDDQQIAGFAARYTLTPREREFAALACKGLQNTDIALIHRLSVNTVRNTLARVFEKAKVSSRLELRFLVTQSAVDPQGFEQHRRQGQDLLSFVSAVRVASELTSSRLNKNNRAVFTNIKYTSPPAI